MSGCRTAVLVVVCGCGWGFRLSLLAVLPFAPPQLLARRGGEGEEDEGDGRTVDPLWLTVPALPTPPPLPWQPVLASGMALVADVGFRGRGGEGFVCGALGLCGSKAKTWAWGGSTRL